MTLIVRAKLDPLTLPNAIRAAIHSVGKDQPLGDFRTVDQIKDQALTGTIIGMARALGESAPLWAHLNGVCLAWC